MCVGVSLCVWLCELIAMFAMYVAALARSLVVPVHVPAHITSMSNYVKRRWQQDEAF